jgi:DGQHR domain-containing protein
MADKEEVADSKEDDPAAFEERVRQLFSDLGLQGVAGGPGFKIGGVQIDACGGLNETLILADCTIKRGHRGVPKQIAPKVDKWRSKADELLDAVRKDSRFTAFSRIALVIAANTTVGAANRTYAEDKLPRISVLTRQNIEYLEVIAKDIKEFAKYRFASILGVQIRRSPLSVPALRLQDRGEPMYMFCAPARDLAELSFVPQAEAGFKYFYQRMIKPWKIKEIGEYVGKEHISRPFPNSVVLALPSEPSFKPSGAQKPLKSGDMEVTSGTLELPPEYGCCWVVDGQHRIYGSALSTPNLLLPVTLVKATDLEKARYFLDINSNQTTIDPNLIWFLNGELEPGSESGLLSRACQALDDIKGPLKGRMKIPGRSLLGGRKVSLAGVCVSIQRSHLLEEAAYRPESEDFVKRLPRDLSNWLIEIDDHIKNPRPKKVFVFRDGGLDVLINIYRRIVKRLDRRPRDEEVGEYAKAFGDWVEKLDPGEAEELARRSSSSSRIQIVETAILHMNRHLPHCPTLEANLPTSEVEKLARLLERDLRPVMNNKLIATIGPDWMRTMNVSAGKPNIKTFEDLSLGDLKNILFRTNVWPLFEEPFKVASLKKEIVIHYFDYLTDYRNPTVHERAHSIDEAVARNYVLTLRRYLVQNTPENTGQTVT